MERRRGIDLFRVAGIQIAIDYSWLLIFLLVLWSLSAGYFPHEYPGHGSGQYWSIGAVATLLFFVSVVIHELAHALVANRLGQEVRRITLFLFGGMAHLSREPRSPTSELGIAAVGPLTSLVLGGLFWLTTSWMRQLGAAALWVAVFQYLAFINVALAAFNLLPGFPLDGGRILRSFFWMRSGDLRAATARAANWGAGIAFGLMMLGVLEMFTGALVGGLWLIFIGMFLREAGRASYQGVVVEQALGTAMARDLMVPDPLTAVPGELTVARAVEDYFLQYGFGGFPVTEDGRIAGLLSLGDIKRCPPEERAARRVREIMQPAGQAVQIPASARATEALRKMAETGAGRLLVTQGEQVIGLITHSGIVRFVQIKTELQEEAQ
jgi:Zn-dependent protease/CBS domain-containing protein